jgi:hypothetical protein
METIFRMTDISIKSSTPHSLPSKLNTRTTTNRTAKLGKPKTENYYEYKYFIVLLLSLNLE